MAVKGGRNSEASRQRLVPETKVQLEAESTTTAAVVSVYAAAIREIDSATALMDISEQEPNITFIEVQTTEHKGQAVFATRKIKAGTLIFSELPVIRLTQVEEDTDKKSTASPGDDLLDERFKVLPRRIQRAYLKLFDSQKSDFSRAKSIYYSNCYNLSGTNRPSKTSPGGSAIGMIASRINHSCIPNVQFSFDEESGTMNFHAIKPIAKGREILSNYDSTYELRTTRQKRQMLYYGFRCDCEACEPNTEFWLKSDERRRVMMEARREIQNCERVFGQRDDSRVAHEADPVHAFERLESMLIKEGMAGLPLADTYRSMSKWAERKMDQANARKWRVKERDVCVICLGVQSVRVKALQAKIDSHR